MSLAVISMISIVCIDAALAAQPAAQTAPQTTDAALAGALDPMPETQIAPSPDADASDNSAVSGAPQSAEDETFDAPLVYAGETDAAVAETLIAYLEDLDTLNGDFTQIAPSGAISTGRFYLRRPGFLRFEYDPPTPLLIVANRGLVYVRDEALETTDSYPVGKTPLKFLVQKKFDRDDARIIAVDRGVDNVAITFASNDEETEGELTLIARAPDLALRRWIVRDLQGGITVVTLDNVKRGERLAMDLFRAPEAGGRFLDR